MFFPDSLFSIPKNSKRLQVPNFLLTRLKHWAKINCLTFWGNDKENKPLTDLEEGEEHLEIYQREFEPFLGACTCCQTNSRSCQGAWKEKSNAVFPSSKCGTEESPPPCMANDPHLELNPSICHFWRGKNPSLSTSLSSLYWVTIFL